MNRKLLKRIQSALLGACFFVLIALTQAYSLGNRSPMAPVKPKTPSVRDGEFLTYSKYIGGEKTDTTYFVTRVNPQKQELNLYIEMEKAGSEYKFPAHYTNYHYFIRVALDKTGLKDSIWNYHDMPEISMKIPSYSDIHIDYDNHQAEYTLKIKDGEEEKITHSRSGFKQGYPAWNLSSIMFTGPRCLDVQGGGLLYVIEPFYIKEPVPGTLKIIGKEVIETRAGKFKTLKIGFSIADPFLGKLLDSYTEKMFFWVEDAPRSLIIKTAMDDNVNLLEGISVWKDKK
jgi:hypothetical protein